MAISRMFGMVNSLAMCGTRKGKSFMKLAIQVVRPAVFMPIQ